MTPRIRKEVDLTTYMGRFADRLRMLREKKKLTVEEAAVKIGVKAVTIYKWEAATNAPNLADLPCIASIYGLKKTKDILPNE